MPLWVGLTSENARRELRDSALHRRAPAPIQLKARSVFTWYKCKAGMRSARSIILAAVVYTEFVHLWIKEPYLNLKIKEHFTYLTVRNLRSCTTIFVKSPRLDTWQSCKALSLSNRSNVAKLLSGWQKSSGAPLEQIISTNVFSQSTHRHNRPHCLSNLIRASSFLGQISRHHFVHMHRFAIRGILLALCLTLYQQYRNTNMTTPTRIAAVTGGNKVTSSEGLVSPSEASYVA